FIAITKAASIGDDCFRGDSLLDTLLSLLLPLFAYLSFSKDLKTTCFALVASVVNFIAGITELISMETYFKPKKIEIKPETVAEDLEKGNKGTGINHEKDLEKSRKKDQRE
ncbi:6833_t:CDS:2, partial [Entrophospora sp. SA101]